MSHGLQIVNIMDWKLVVRKINGKNSKHVTKNSKHVTREGCDWLTFNKTRQTLLL